MESLHVVLPVRGPTCTITAWTSTITARTSRERAAARACTPPPPFLNPCSDLESRLGTSLASDLTDTYRSMQGAVNSESASAYSGAQRLDSTVYAEQLSSRRRLFVVEPLLADDFHCNSSSTSTNLLQSLPTKVIGRLQGLW